MGVIATLLPNPLWGQRLRLAVRERHQILPCEDWSGLMRACENEPVHLAVFDLYADGTLNLEHVRQMRRRFPRCTLVAYVNAALERARDMFDAGRIGIDGLVLADRDDQPQGLRAIVEQAEARSIAGVVRSALPTDLRALLRDALLISVTRAHERLSPEGLARLLTVSRRTLAQRLQEAGFPPPQRLLTWGRLIVAAHLLEDRNRSADSVAHVLDFPSGSAFRNTCQRYLKSTPQQIRDKGGAQFVLHRLLAILGTEEAMGAGDADLDDADAGDDGFDEADAADAATNA
jgi:AraC-like DNA-binding protein